MNSKTKTPAELQLVLFDLASEHYAVSSQSVREIIRMQSITRVPGASAFVEGVTNLRGRIVPVLDLRKRLALPVGGESKEMRIVVVEAGNDYVGLIVDGVSEVLRIPYSLIEPPSSIVYGPDADYILGIAKLETKLVILLDTGKLLSTDEKQAVSASTHGMESEVSSVVG
jgi:purine-binding chemotaxis protein CheW